VPLWQINIIMRNILYLLLFSTQFFFAQSGFENGNAFYAKGKYTEAAAAYESVLKNNQHSSELYFNLGNAYYKLNQVAPAIYNYEKALVLNPENVEAAGNLKFAQKRTIDEFKVIPKVGFAKLIQDFTGQFDYDVWGKIALGFSFLFFTFFLVYYFSRKPLLKRVFFTGMSVAFVLLLVVLSAAFFEKKYYYSERPAIVFAEKTDVKKEPREGGKPLLAIHEGAKVYVFETIGKWKKIQLTDGTSGWIESSAIKEVK
jgi:tetratricopeptide (TPR) repeat protein